MTPRAMVLLTILALLAAFCLWLYWREWQEKRAWIARAERHEANAERLGVLIMQAFYAYRDPTAAPASTILYWLLRRSELINTYDLAVALNPRVVANRRAGQKGKSS